MSPTTGIEPFEFRQKMGSTDVGDVSWNVPTAGFGTATWVPGTPAHSWQAVAAGGMSIGHKGMMLAAKVLAETARSLYTDAELIAKAKAEFAWNAAPPTSSTRPLLGDARAAAGLPQVNVLLLHPGAMGASIGAALVAGGHDHDLDRRGSQRRHCQKGPERGPVADRDVGSGA